MIVRCAPSQNGPSFFVQELLKGDSIKYSIFPVSGYEDIQRHADKGISQNDEVTLNALDTKTEEKLPLIWRYKSSLEP
jgi:hypothetical protein